MDYYKFCFDKFLTLGDKRTKCMITWIGRKDNLLHGNYALTIIFHKILSLCKFN